MNKLDKQYLQLVQDILDYGVEKKDRTTTGTKSIFGYTIRHKMSDGFPLLTTKKLHWKSVVSELLWFLNGRTDLRWLLEQDNTIWVGDAYKRFLNETIKIEPAEAKERAVTQLLSSKESKEEFINKIKTDDEFAKKWGELGEIYGAGWRRWKTFTYDDYANRPKWIEDDPVDQIANLINDLKTNPDSRRLMVSAWNVGELDQMVLPPCHFSWQCYSHEKDGKRYLSLAWNQRSCDVGLGIPFNIASYGLLLEIIAKITNMVPDELIGNLGDTHLYSNHIEPIKEQLTREPFELPKLVFSNQIHFSDNIDEFLNSCLITDFTLENYQSHPTIKLPLSN